MQKRPGGPEPFGFFCVERWGRGAGQSVGHGEVVWAHLQGSWMPWLWLAQKLL